MQEQNMETYVDEKKHGANGKAKPGKVSQEAADLDMKRREQEALWKILNTTSIISEADKKGDILTVNDKLCQVSQYTEEECLGRPHNMFRHPDMPKEVFKQMWATIGRGQVFRGVVKNRKKDGSPYYVDAVISPVLDDNGKPIKYLGVRYEITEQEIERQNMKGILSAIDSAYAYIEFDIKGIVLTANNNFLSLMGYKKEEIIGKHHRQFVEVAFANSNDYSQLWLDLNAGKIQSDVYKRITKEGREVWIQAVYAPVKDEVGKIFKVVKIATDVTKQILAQNDLKNKVDLMLKVVNAAGAGDLTSEVTVSGSDPAGQIGEGLKKFLTDLRSSVSAIAQNSQALASSSEEMNAVGQQMSSNAEETSAQSNVVSAAAEQVSKNIQTVAAGAEELNASIKEIAKNAVDAARVATQAVKVTEMTNATITKLGDSSTEIGNVVKVITSIAQQTNLLALNATIEAARAGEAGKGFAVVANEVKELAKETAKATEDISRKIEMIQGDTKESVKAIGEISTIIGQINEIQNTIASAVEEQSATTNEIGRNVAEAAKGSSEIAQNIMGVAQAAKSTSEGASNSQSAAKELSRMAAELQKLVAQFKY